MHSVRDSAKSDKSIGIGDHIASLAIAGTSVVAIALILLIARNGSLPSVALTILILLGAVVFGIVSVELFVNCLGVITQRGFRGIRPALVLAELVVLALLFVVQLGVPRLVSMYFWLFAGAAAAGMAFIEIKRKLFG